MPESLQTLGRYKILRVIGRGAMGVVYEAVDPDIDRVVAIKTINLMLSPEEMEQYEARFKQEIKAAGKLNHPNIVTIYDVGKTDNMAYMAMEFINGCELKDLLKAGTALPVDVALDLVSQAAEGLAFAHSRDIIHRDVKPANIMLLENEDGLVAKITDFGIARMPASAVKTMTGMVMGSPRYMSPEQVVGRNLSARSDIFSLGVVLYEALTGMAPFESDTISSIMYQTVHVAPQPPSSINSKLDPELDAIVAKALEKSPENRFESMKAFSRRLREVIRARAGGTAMSLAQLSTSPGMPAQSTTTAPPSAAATTQPLAVQDLDGTRLIAAMSSGAESTAPRPAVSTPAATSPPQARTTLPPRSVPPPAQPAQARGEDREGRERWPVTVSNQFDSTTATLRLAEMTGQTAELQEFISASRQMPALVEAAEANAANAPAGAATRKIKAITLTMDALPEDMHRKIPMPPLLLLGGLGSTVLALLVALVLTF
ncbi:MAG: protein kinase [Betaproteobacteria bacterium]